MGGGGGTELSSTRPRPRSGGVEESSGDASRTEASRSDLVQAFIAMVVVGFVARIIGLGEGDPVWWTDSKEYLAISKSGWGSFLFGGLRPPLVPALLRLTGGQPGNTFVAVNVLTASTAWAWLALECSRVMPTRPRRWIIGLAVLAFSLTAPVMLWDRSILSESLALALLAAVVACGLWAMRRQDLLACAGFVTLSGLWVTTRDTNAVPLLLVGLGCVACGLAWRRPRGRTLLATGVGLVLVVVVTLPSVAEGGRGDRPLAHVLLTHPSYLVSEPLTRPERTFNNAGGDVENYRPKGTVAMPAVTVVLWPPALVSVGLAAAIAGWWALRGRPRTPLFLAAAVLAGTAVPSAWIAWHSDGMESTRHLLVPETAFRLGVLLGVAAVLQLWRCPVPLVAHHADQLAAERT